MSGSVNNNYGFPLPIAQSAPKAVVSTSAPTTSQWNYPLGQIWVNKSSGIAYILASKASRSGTWVVVSDATAGITSLTGDTGTATPSAGNIKIAGTAAQITSTASGSTVTLTLPAVVTAPGSLATTTTLASGTTLTAGTSLSVTTSATVGTTITATLGNITATNGNVVLGSAGNKLVIHATTAANDSVGLSAALSGTPGTLTVSTTACTASSKVFVQRATPGGTLGNISVPTASIGSGSFVINSDANETSTFMYWIVN